MTEKRLVQACGHRQEKRQGSQGRRATNRLLALLPRKD
jgi:hypothetical protein